MHEERYPLSWPWIPCGLVEKTCPRREQGIAMERGPFLLTQRGVLSATVVVGIEMAPRGSHIWMPGYQRLTPLDRDEESRGLVGGSTSLGVGSGISNAQARPVIPLSLLSTNPNVELSTSPTLRLPSCQHASCLDNYTTWN